VIFDIRVGQEQFVVIATMDSRKADWTCDTCNTRIASLPFGSYFPFLSSKADWTCDTCNTRITSLPFGSYCPFLSSRPGFAL
jgi:endogenous inhibitor of DNA gyrase (YacG/DUF329 family)